jgi:hypothetical protein
LLQSYVKIIKAVSVRRYFLSFLTQELTFIPPQKVVSLQNQKIKKEQETTKVATTKNAG